MFEAQKSRLAFEIATMPVSAERFKLGGSQISV
jgi:hypothetical protein